MGNNCPPNCALCIGEDLEEDDFIYPLEWDESDMDFDEEDEILED